MGFELRATDRVVKSENFEKQTNTLLVLVGRILALSFNTDFLS